MIFGRLEDIGRPFLAQLIECRKRIGQLVLQGLTPSGGFSQLHVAMTDIFGKRRRLAHATAIGLAIRSLCLLPRRLELGEPLLQLRPRRTLLLESRVQGFLARVRLLEGLLGTLLGPGGRHHFGVARLLLAWFLGVLGIDRFYLGHTGLGVAKLLTCGGLGIWALIDLILIAVGSVKDVHGLPLRR